MLIRIVVTLLLYGSVIGCTYHKLHANSRKEKTVIVLILCCSLYSAVSFIRNENWPNVDELINLLFARQLQEVIEYLERL
jgi:hypothetical protein